MPATTPLHNDKTSPARTHDPREHIRGFQQLLASPSKRLGFFVGAGTSMAVTDKDKKPLIPGVVEMTQMVGDGLSSAKLKKAYFDIQAELKFEGQNTHIEYILSNVRLKAQVIGVGILCGLNQKELKELEGHITDSIQRLVSPTLPDQLPAHEKFARWIHNAGRKTPIEIFTTNYDYLFEVAFERELVAYFDGFVGSHDPFFHSAAVLENTAPTDWVRLWKLHGSLGWRMDEKLNRIVRDKGDKALVVFPSLLKYDDSRKQPYVSFIDRLSAFLRTDDSLLVICGYSFSDPHLNETIINALARTRTAATFAFQYGDLPRNCTAAKIAEKEPRLSVFGKNAGVIGGRYGEWRLNREPSKSDSNDIDRYFDERAVPAEPSAKPATKPTGKPIPEEEKTWAGEGDLRLGDFVTMINFLTSMISSK